MSRWDQSPGDGRPAEGIWEKLSQVAIKGAEYDSPERQPHPKCLEGTRVNLLDHIYDLLGSREKSRLIWLHGTAGVGKSAVAFTVAERMRDLKVTAQTTSEKRLAGTFFFSRKYTERCTTGYFFATLAYQLATNFPSIRDDVITTIRENPALLDPKKSLRDQMEALFLRPLRRLQLRLLDCPPLVFTIDALDECTSETEISHLISLLGRALHEPDLPVTHILLTSRSEAHICEAIHGEEVHPLVCEIPVKTSGEGVLISLDGADVDTDIYIFLKHSFTKLRSCCSYFPQPTEDELARLASRAGRRFIVASTMMKFIDDGYSDPHDRLQLMLELTSKLLPGTEVYKLYDRIISTCSDPERAYLHLSIVAALANPLPISQISELLGPGQGRDVETVLVQLRSVMDIPYDRSLPISIYHSSIRDYVLDPSKCSLFKGQCITSPHSLLAHSSLRLMIQCIPKSTGLLDALLTLKMQSPAMESHDPQTLQQSLAFIVQPPEPLHILISLLWLRGDRRPELQCWLETLDGCTWLSTQGGTDWLRAPSGQDWVQTHGGHVWLQTRGGGDWIHSQDGHDWLQTQGGFDWLWTESGRAWLQTPGGFDWLRAESGWAWLQTQGGCDWLQIQGGHDWLLTKGGHRWLQTTGGHHWLQITGGHHWLQTAGGDHWLQTTGGHHWLWTEDRLDWKTSSFPLPVIYPKQALGRENQLQPEVPDRRWLLADWLQIPNGRKWLQTQSGREWLQMQSGRKWLELRSGQEWLQTLGGQEWLQTLGGRKWLQTLGGREWLQTQSGREWLQTPHGQAWRLTPAASIWVQMEEFSSTVEAVSKFMIIPEAALLAAFQVIQQFTSLPDFLMLPAFLAFTIQSFTSASPQACLPVDIEIIHSIKAFASFANEARERSWSTSDALSYACQNWAIHLSQAPNSWDDMLNYIFKVFWDHHLPSWLERQWCLKGLQSCVVVLSEGQKLAKDHLLQVSGNSSI